MISLTALWMPILVSAVVVFIASSLVHTLIGHHNSDYGPLPDEAATLAALRGLNIPPGEYRAPYANGSTGMKDPAYLAKVQQGPRALMTLKAGGNEGMGASLTQWFVYLLIVSTFAAYLASRTLPAAAHYLEVFRIAGTTAFMAYAMSHPSVSIWFGRSWSATFKYVIDGLVYGLLTGGVFGWLWPHVVPA
jgi:hypothetical protein